MKKLKEQIAFDALAIMSKSAQRQIKGGASSSEEPTKGLLPGKTYDGAGDPAATYTNTGSDITS